MYMYHMYLCIYNVHVLYEYISTCNIRYSIFRYDKTTLDCVFYNKTHDDETMIFRNDETIRVLIILLKHMG